MYTMDYPNVIVSNQKETPITIQRVNDIDIESLLAVRSS